MNEEACIEGYNMTNLGWKNKLIRLFGRCKYVTHVHVRFGDLVLFPVEGEECRVMRATTVRMLMGDPVISIPMHSKHPVTPHNEQVERATQKRVSSAAHILVYWLLGRVRGLERPTTCVSIANYVMWWWYEIDLNENIHPERFIMEAMDYENDYHRWPSESREDNACHRAFTDHLRARDDAKIAAFRKAAQG